MTRRVFLSLVAGPQGLKRLTRQPDGTSVTDQGDAFELRGPLTEAGQPGDGYYAIGEALALVTPDESAIKTRLQPLVNQQVFLRVGPVR